MRAANMNSVQYGCLWIDVLGEYDLGIIAKVQDGVVVVRKT